MTWLESCGKTAAGMQGALASDTVTLSLRVLYHQKVIYSCRSSKARIQVSRPDPHKLGAVTFPLESETRR